jgi:heterodisulfide reductase subunit A
MDGSFKEIYHGVTIVATGASEWSPDTYFYGDHPGVVTHLDLEKYLADENPILDKSGKIVFIQCVGSRNDQRPYCNRVCCTHSVKAALDLKERDPEAEITILYRDMRTFGLKESFYREACERGIQFIRFDPESPPDVECIEEGESSSLRVTVNEPILGYPLALEADMLVLAAAVIPAQSNQSLSTLLKVPLNEDGFFMEAHMKLRPVDFATDGIFVCGMAHGPKFMDESVSQAMAAASRAMTILSKGTWTGGGVVGTVDAMLCAGCGACVSVCPFGALEMDNKKLIVVLNEALCKGCGVCSSSCRSGAIDIYGFSDAQTFSQIFAA